MARYVRRTVYITKAQDEFLRSHRELNFNGFVRRALMERAGVF